MGFGGGSGGSSAISGATDVALDNPIDTQVLSYDVSTTKWRNSPSRMLISSQTSSYTLVADDAGKAVEVNASGATNVTIPTNASVAFPIGTVIEVVQLGAGRVTIAAAGGVTLQAADGALTTRVQYSAVSLRKRATNTWLIVGDLE